ADRGVGRMGGEGDIREGRSGLGEDVLHNTKLVEDCQRKHSADGTVAHDRAWLYRDVDPWEVIRLFRALRCPDDISSTNFNDYSAYLQDWLNGKNLPPFPRINVAIAPHEGTYKRRREFDGDSRPTSAAIARTSVLP